MLQLMKDMLWKQG